MNVHHELIGAGHELLEDLQGETGVTYRTPSGAETTGVVFQHAGAADEPVFDQRTGGEVLMRTVYGTVRIGSEPGSVPDVGRNGRFLINVDGTADWWTVERVESSRPGWRRVRVVRPIVIDQRGPASRDFR